MRAGCMCGVTIIDIRLRHEGIEFIESMDMDDFCGQKFSGTGTAFAGDGCFLSCVSNDG